MTRTTKTEIQKQISIKKRKIAMQIEKKKKLIKINNIIVCF